MESSSSLGIVVAFTAGVLSFLSPCVLPLIPSYVTFITGLSLEDAARARRTALVHSLLFVAGFTLIFVALGATATLLGRVLLSQRVWISRVGGALVVLFGFYLLGALNVAAFSRERRIHLADKPVGYLGTVLVGITFGAGWTPCLGPILSAILVYTSTRADLAHGIGLLFAYSLGLAVPFVGSAIAVERFLSIFARVRRQMAWVSRASGVLLIAVGVLLMTNYFTVLASYLQGFTPDFLRSRL
jgi:cytochrome c-type biogenesis protein